MSNKKLRMGSVGLGRLGSLHAQNLATCIEGAKLVSVCDTNDAALDSFVKRFNDVKPYKSYDEMINSGEIDAVALVSPSGLHAEHSI
ncbi:MAG: Gfo/Idh/MocA family oxidoreductase, partial [Oligoflexales bacterium]|nr:Gfo/Idh/MocA family oxidoreductase [Oligoflexales bacterium]